VLVAENSFYTLCRDFRASPKFKGFSKATQDLWSRELDFACRPNCLGAVSLDMIRPALVQGYLDGWDDKPGKQAAALAAFKALERWAVVRDLLPRQITIGVETGKPQGGHVPWTDAHVEIAEQHVRADFSRVITLGANTGQRISDLVRMGWGDIETFRGIDGINVRQKKTGRQVWVPILAPLAIAMTTWERRPGPFLLRANGKPWASNHLTDRWDYEKKINLNLAEHRRLGLVLHGLRGHACVRLRRAGLTALQISDTIGMSVGMVERYCRFSAQMENAVAAVIQLQGTVAERNAARDELSTD
jgi:integrase